MSEGVEMIAEERARQLSIGWSTAHDDREPIGALSRAAACYAAPGKVPDDLWPWKPSELKLKGQLTNLVRAGALIAAEIDKILRAAPEQATEACGHLIPVITENDLKAKDREYAKGVEALDALADRQKREQDLAKKEISRLEKAEYEDVALGLLQNYKIQFEIENSGPWNYYWLAYGLGDRPSKQRLLPEVTVEQLYELGAIAEKDNEYSVSPQENVAEWVHKLSKMQSLEGLSMLDRVHQIRKHRLCDLVWSSLHLVSVVAWRQFNAGSLLLSFSWPWPSGENGYMGIGIRNKNPRGTISVTGLPTGLGTDFHVLMTVEQLLLRLQRLSDER